MMYNYASLIITDNASVGNCAQMKQIIDLLYICCMEIVANVLYCIIFLNDKYMYRT